MAWKYNAGLGMIALFVLIWVIAAEVTQEIFSEYKQPFAVTYLLVSIMVVFLPIAYLKDCVSSKFGAKRWKGLDDIAKEARTTGELSIPLISSETAPSPDSGMVLESKDMPRRDLTGDREEDLTEMLMADEEQQYRPTDPSSELRVMEIVKCCLYLTPIWFFTEVVANCVSSILLRLVFLYLTVKFAGFQYFANSALANTSVASTTVLTSTSGLFTLFFGTLLGQESITVTKVFSVLISMAGVAMTTVGETWASDEMLSSSEARRRAIIGNIFGLLSAAFYGLFTVLLKKSSGSEGGKVDVEKIFGYIGLFCIVGLWWIGWPLHAMGIEPAFSLPHSNHLKGVVVVNGLIGTVITDYFWALSVVWTTPLVATLGMSLTIPIAMVADMLVHGRRYSLVYIAGCIQASHQSAIAYISFSSQVTCTDSSCFRSLRDS
ncbi:hypothetical protein MLD38_006409 [Melastoma candidum]|uniref:Uncharacterized protein n=1 Tax=Melastoma candidum TaxID=119954 RepID=A0ACB9RMD9_9MYRT|nr:hypothetical protein MLD38_006409 [Melastoma candidum]